MQHCAIRNHVMLQPVGRNSIKKTCSIDLLPRSIQYDDGTSALGVTARGKLYVATCSPARDVAAGYVAWGHSSLISPFGEVLATTEHDEAIIISEIDYSQNELQRTNLPLEKQRRGDLSW